MRFNLHHSLNALRRIVRFGGQALVYFLLLGSSSAWAALGVSVTLVSGQPTAIFPGETTQLQITLSNNNALAPISGVGFSNSLPGTLPNGLKVAATPTVSCNDPATSPQATTPGIIAATIGAQSISLSDEIIPARANEIDGTCTIVITVTAGTSSINPATYPYTIADGSVTGNDGVVVANSGTVTQSVNVKALAKPTIAKVFAPSTLVMGGSASTLTITLTNSNTVAITGVSLTDTFPTNAGGALIQVADTPTASNTCGATFAPVAGDVSLSATGGTIPASSSCTISVSVKARQTNGLYSVSGTNTINLSTDFTNDIGIPAAANATASITVTSPLSVAKSFSPSNLAGGQAGVLTITLSNSGPTDLTINTFQDSPIDGINDTLSTTGLLVTSVDNSCGGTATAVQVNGIDQGVLLTGGTIPAKATVNGSCTVTVNFTANTQAANTPYTYTNTISAGAVNLTGAPGVVSESKTATILVSDTLRVLKANNSSNPRPGNPAQYAITVQNWSDTDMSNVRIQDNLPGGMTYLTGTINGINFTPTLSGTGCSGLTTSNAVGDSALSFIVGTLPHRTSISSPGACVVTFYAMVSTSAANGASTVNSISSVCTDNGAGICYGAGASSGNSTVSTTVLAATKTFDGATTKTYPEGTISTLKIALANYSANALTNVSLSDTLPSSSSGSGQLRIASPANAATNCGGSPVITAVAGSTSLSMNSASVPARAGNGTGAAGACFIQVSVVGPAGIYPNTATVAGTETYANNTTHTVGSVTSSSATLTYTSALSASTTFAPSSVSSGGKSTATVRLSNSGAVALSGVALTDPLPSGMVLAATPNAYTTCAGGATVTAVAGASSIGMSGASIAGAGNCDVVFDVTATGSANWVNTIPVGNITASGGVSNQVAVVGTLTYVAPTGITVAKATNPSTLTFPGQISQLTITLNSGTQAVSGLSLTDHFTADGTAGGALNGMEIAPTPSAATTCPGGVVSAAAGATSVSLSGVSMAASTSCTVTVNVTSTSVGGITNFIPIGSVATDQGLTNSGQASTSLTTQSNIGVTKQFTPNVVTPGTRSRLRITFYNPTAQPGTNLAVTDTLPTGVTVPSGADPQTTCTGATVSSSSDSKQVLVSGGSIVAASGGVSASCYAEIDVVAAAQGDYVNTIAAGTVTASVGGASASNSQPTSDTLRVKSPLVIHTAFSGKTLDTGNPVGFTTGSDSKAPGAAAVMTIRLDNPNSADLTSAAFTDTLPTGLVVGTTPNAATTCTGGSVTAAASGTSVRLTGATIPASGYCTVTVNVLSNISASYTNTIAAGGVTTYEGVSNAEATSAKIMVSTPPTVSKQFSPAVIAPGGTSTLTIVLGNSNTSAVTLNSAFVDNLPTAPGNIYIAASPNVVKTCPGAVTATASSGTSITYASGATIPAGGCTISVNVTGATPGDHTNNIPAGTLTTDFGNNQQAANAVLTVSTMAYVSGRVFQDNNVTPNGTYDSGTDTPLAGVSIELHSGANCSGALVSFSGLTNPVTTDVLGNYMFAGLSAGTYSVCEPAQPGGTNNGITTAGAITPVNGSTGTAGVASNPTATSSQIVNIVLNGDGSSSSMSGSAGNNFAEIVLSSISGTVFLDQNNNGAQNGADTGIAGVGIELLDNANALLSTATTDASGNYSFTGLVPGNYAVREPTQPSGTSNGITTAGAVANSGTAGSVTGVTTVPSVIGGTTKIILPPNTAATGNNFADIPNGRTLSGRVFLDFDNSGTLNGSDHGIGQQTINLTGTDINGNAVTATAATVSAGTYSFTALPEGTYTVTEPAQPSGTVNGITTAGSTGGTATTVGVTPSAISGISLLGSYTVSANNNFADVPDAAADLAISKTHSPSSFGENSSTGFFTITPSNIGTIASSGTVTVVDTLPTGMTVAAAATGSGWTCSGAVGATTVTCTSTDIIAAGASGNPITLRVLVANGLAGQLLTNTAVVSGGGEPLGFDSNNTASDTVAISTTATVSGTVWFDANHDRVLEAGETSSTLISGWQVELILGNVLVASATSSSSGTYSFAGVAPGSGYTIRFRHPVTGLLWGSAVANEQGITPSNGTRDNATAAVNGTNAGNPAGATITGDGTLSSLTLFAGDNIVQQSLPLDPAGVVYDSVTRNPVSGAVVTISGPTGFSSANVVGGSLSQTTGTDGLYQFLLNAGAPAGTYILEVTGFPGGYLPLPSVLIPACSDATPLTVNSVPNPALVQASNSAPAAGATVHDPATCPATTTGLNATNQASTQYYYRFNLSSTSANVVNNHIAIDPILGGAIALSKKTPLVNVSRGDLVPYTITATNTLSATLSNIDVRDQLPPGFKFKTGTATLDGIPVAPTVSGRVLTWPSLTFTSGQSRVIRLTTVVGSGVSEGSYVNQAYALNNIVGAAVSNTASATVRVVPDPTFDCSDLIGKVFDDKNINGYQDAGEPGIPNVRLATVNGLLVTTDAQGRYHVTCAMVPNEWRGSNFLMKLDERTLPTGFRVTTENPRDVRLTRGKMSKLNFGATIHRVVRLDVNDAAYSADALKAEWQTKLEKMPELLKERPSVLRLAYKIGTDGEEVARKRLKALSREMRSKWKAKDCCHLLQIEEELIQPSAAKREGR